MNTYIIPFCDCSKVWIEKVRAKSYKEAQDKLMERCINNWDIDVPTDWDDFKQILDKEDILIGKIVDVEELL